METLKSISISDYKKSHNIQKLFIIKTSKVYNDESGNPTSTKRCYATSSESGEPLVWLAKSGADAVEAGNTAGLMVSTVKTEAGTFEVITATKRQVVATL